MATKYKAATCHPDRLHAAKGLCALCYAQQYHAANREKKLAQMRAYNQAVRTGRARRRPAPCHPTRPHFARELCERCYHQSEHARALRKARHESKSKPPAPTGARIKVTSGATPLRGVIAVEVRERGSRAASFFARKAPK